MISNPCQWFINGSNRKEFTYEGGTTLYHFSPNDNNLSRTMECNVVFFANDEKHALDVLKRMMTFRIKCANEYIEANKDSGSYHSQDFIRRTNDYNSETSALIRAIEDGKVQLSIAPVNQFYKAGWACNDNILG